MDTVDGVGKPGLKTPDASPARRLVLLGASNLTRGISTVLASAGELWNEPLDCLVALGHGRSYGMQSRVLGRALPGIVPCGLWSALASRSPLPTAALLTDVGNDLMYEVEVPRIVGWLEACLDRLAAVQARVVITRLPIGNLERLGATRFRLLRSIIFPRCRLSLADVSERARALDEEVRRLSRERDCWLAEQRSEWYGFDPIHIRRRQWRDAWCEILGTWRDDRAWRARSAGSLARWLYLRSRAPEIRWWYGIAQRRAQPAGRLANGCVVSLY